MSLYYYLVLLVVAERILELALSRAHQRKLKQRGYAQREPNSDFKFMLMLHLLWISGLVFEPRLFNHQVSQRLEVVLSSLGIILFMFAQALRFWVLATLGEHWNVQVMIPHAENSKEQEIISSGPYRYMRHPNYLAIILEFISLPLVGKAYITAVLCSVLNILVLRRRISTEESWLMQIPEYRNKMRSKPRLLPKFSL